MLYTVLIYGVDGVFERLPEEEQKQHLEQHGKVQQLLKDKGIYRGALRLMPPNTATTVRERNDQVVLLDGPFAETKEQILGLYLVETDNIEDALEAAKTLPQGIASMEVRPVMWGSETLTGGDGQD